MHLNRVFGFSERGLFDPFLLLDDFHSSDPLQYQPGFPWHPHRGIETITYLLKGEVEHGDSLRNSGVIGPGDVQWMTAGRGIVHQEMLRGDGTGELWGFQLWANLPAAEKMCEPQYRGFTNREIPRTALPGGGEAKVISGEIAGTRGPVEGIAISPEYFDVTLGEYQPFSRGVPEGKTALLYLLEGSLDGADDLAAGSAGLVNPEGGESFTAGPRGARFLWIAGTPLKEPIAWYGPIVMNTREELEQAFRQYEDGIFLNPPSPVIDPFPPRVYSPPWNLPSRVFSMTSPPMWSWTRWKRSRTWISPA